MKNNIKKTPVKFWEDLLFFSILCRFLFLLQISDYHHLKLNKRFNKFYLFCKYWKGKIRSRLNEIFIVSISFSVFLE